MKSSILTNHDKNNSQTESVVLQSYSYRKSNCVARFAGGGVNCILQFQFVMCGLLFLSFVRGFISNSHNKIYF